MKLISMTSFVLENAIQPYVEGTKDIIGSLHYQTNCILEIIKEGNDKELFAELEKKLN